ncbi:MAG: hypothetical protein J6Q44_00515, partial [Alphaproteobacteria bacterium]|nr:hypothetical protein [Alphaproteobacteria bacterium]
CILHSFVLSIPKNPDSVQDQKNSKKNTFSQLLATGQKKNSTPSISGAETNHNDIDVRSAVPVVYIPLHEETIPPADMPLDFMK